MAATLIHESELIEVQNLAMLIFGPPGAGKTSLAQTAEASLTLDLDKGIHRSAFRKDAMRFDVWADLKEIEATLPDYKTIVPDTVGRLLDMLSQDIIRANPKHGNATSGLSLQGFGALKARFAQWQGQLRLWGKDVVFIAHEKEEKDGDERIMRPDVQGASYTELMKVVDLVGYLSLDGRGQRWLDFNPTEKHTGKNAAGWQRMQVPDLGAAPDFMARLLADAKARIGRTSAASAAVAKAVEEWIKYLASDPNIEQINDRLGEVAKLTNGTRIQVAHVIREKMNTHGHTYDKTAKRYVPKPEVAA